MSEVGRGAGVTDEVLKSWYYEHCCSPAVQPFSAGDLSVKMRGI